MSTKSWLIDRLLLKQPNFRRWLTRLLEGDRTENMTLFGASIRINSIREHGYLRAARFIPTSSFFHDEAPVLLAMASLLPWADGFVDVGANVGVYSKILYRFKALYPLLEFHAFEADPETVVRLGQTLTGTGVQIHPFAVGDSDTTQQFVRGAVSHVTTRSDLASRYSLNDTFTVAVRRLDGCGLRGRALLLKIDVEGAELAVLHGAQGLFDQQRIVAVYLDGCADADTVATFLNRQGFRFFDGRTLVPADFPPYSLLAIHRSLLERLPHASAAT
jgi:FkbM family methyltransferase